MALVIPRRLFAAKVRSKLLVTLSVQPYHCHALTKPELKRKQNLVLVDFSRPHWIEPLRQYSSSGSSDNVDNKNTQKLSLFQKFKQMYRDYWYVLVPVHIVTSAAWLGGLYYLASSGVDVPAMLESMNFNEKIVNSMRNSSMGYFAITYGLYKIATPVRYAITLGGTTVSINYLKKWGYIKPIPSKERLKEIYTETKEGMKERRENLMESVHHIQKSVKETKEGIKGTNDSIVTSVKKPKESIKKINQKAINNNPQKSKNKP